MKWIVLGVGLLIAYSLQCPPVIEQKEIDSLVRRLSAEKVACEVLFCPDENARAVLCSFIENEQEKILIAVFCFTDKIIADHLIAAHNRGVKIEIITNPTCIASDYHKMDMIRDAGIAVYVYNPDYGKTSTRFFKSIMHHKFAIFFCTSKKLNIIWTGSLNFTRSACTINQENSVIIKDKTVVKKYLQQFKLLKKRAVAYKAQPKKQPAPPNNFLSLWKTITTTLQQSATSLSIIFVVLLSFVLLVCAV
jgi:phosphatidylserine/phosphatidylglycerophosphate/cardiolipin synthase-like enzyme